MTDEKESPFRFAISLSVLNHLGRNLYRNFITVLGEAVSNSWDADAKNVFIYFDKDKDWITILDDGIGMTKGDFQDKFLKIGYSKRKDGKNKTSRGRPFIGAKGIGKLALLSCADRVTIISKNSAEDWIGGTIDNSGLDKAITDNLNPDDYPLEEPDFSLVAEISEWEQGTFICFEGAKEVLRTSEDQIRKLLALSFHFAVVDPEFTIFLNDVAISVEDLRGLAESTEFVWKIKDYQDDFLDACVNVKEWIDAPDTKLDLVGFLATVEKPSNLNIRGADNRATIDLFVNGRLRERNLIRHFPSQRIVESYLYGQIHFNSMDGDGDSPFTSSREGIVETDPNFESLIDYLRRHLLPVLIDSWDALRLARGREGDAENTRKTRKQRQAAGLVAAAEEEATAGLPNEQGHIVDQWVAELRPDAEFNVAAYVDCFLSENLVRKYITHSNTPLTPPSQREAKNWKDGEAQRKQEANINFDIRRDNIDVSYLGMDFLAISAEGGKSKDGKPTPLHLLAVAFRPVRNAVGHTGLLTELAKSHLTLTFENIKGRVKALLSGMNPNP